MDCKCCKTWLLGLVLLGKLIVAQLINKLLMIYGTISCILCLQVPATCPEPIQHCPQPPPLFISISFYCQLPNYIQISQLLFLSGFSDPHFVCISHVSHEGYVVCQPPLVYLAKLTRVQLKFPQSILNLHHPTASSPISRNILLNSLLTLSFYFFPLRQESIFHTHTK